MPINSKWLIHDIKTFFKIGLILAMIYMKFIKI